MMKPRPAGGRFVISLDFEMMWGVRDIVTVDTYGQHIKGVHQVIPRLLDCFTRHQIRGTFATVGFLFFENKQELLQHLPERFPAYHNPKYSPYGDYLDQLGRNRETDPYHFGAHLVKKIQETPGQEIGTHTFSHYYCLEAGQTMDDFRADLRAAVTVAARRGIAITSIVFPRNQFNPAYLSVCREFGVTTYRNNEESWLYIARPDAKESLLRRAVRLLDAYINISGHHTYTDAYMKAAAFPMVNVPSSRFLRPYTKSLRWLEWLRLRRIKNSMTYAAQHNLMYHLWWHPHNFGINQDQNFGFLEKILEHYQYLQERYGFRSVTMSELTAEITEQSIPERKPVFEPAASVPV